MEDGYNIKREFTFFKNLKKSRIIPATKSLKVTIELEDDILRQSLENAGTLGLTLEEYIKKVVITGTLLISSKTLNLDPFEYINPKQ